MVSLRLIALAITAFLSLHLIAAAPEQGILQEDRLQGAPGFGLVQKRASQGTCVRSSQIELTAMRGHPCTFEQKNPREIIIKSPDYPNDYPNKIRCYARLSTNKPAFLIITSKTLNSDATDEITFVNPFALKTRVLSCSCQDGKRLFAPSAAGAFVFTSKNSPTFTAKNFEILVEAVATKCFQTCTLSDGNKGIIEQTWYRRDTFCEYLLQAPKDCKISLKFISLNVGTSQGTGRCPDDFVGIDRTGNALYRLKYSSKHCGDTVPSKAIVSEANEMRLIFVGKKGAGDGYKAEYTVKC